MDGILDNEYSVEALAKEVQRLPKQNFLGSYGR
jgi:hypothetical protein